MVFDHSLHVYMTAKKFTKEHTYMYICYIHAHIHKYITYIYTSTHTYVHTYTHAYIHAYIHVYIHIYIHTYITYIPTYIHAYIHTHTYIHVHDSCWHTWLCLILNCLAAKGLRYIGVYHSAPDWFHNNCTYKDISIPVSRKWVLRLIQKS